MKKFFIITLLLVVTLSLATAYFWNKPYGYVILSNGEWAMERSLSQFGIILICTFIAFYAAVWLLGRLIFFPATLRRYWLRKNRERAHRDIIQGLIAIIEGHPLKAERILLKNITHSETKLINYLLAARAAQLAEADDRRDAYLKKAHDTTPKADMAIGLTQAELQFAHNQIEQALATLSRLREIAPKHAYVLKLLTRLYIELNEWEKLLQVLPEVRKRKLFNEEKLLEIEQSACIAWLKQKANVLEMIDLKILWSQLPSSSRNKPPVLHVYVESLMAAKQTTDAEKILRQALNKLWDEQLARIYGLIKTDNLNKQLEYAEAWMRDHGRSPMLLLTLGRLCYRLRLWGKARVYFETSIAIHPTVEAYKELGSLLASLGEKENAARYWKEGLELATQKSGERRLGDKPSTEPGRIAHNETLSQTDPLSNGSTDALGKKKEPPNNV